MAIFDFHRKENSRSEKHVHLRENPPTKKTENVKFCTENENSVSALNIAHVCGVSICGADRKSKRCRFRTGEMTLENKISRNYETTKVRKFGFAKLQKKK